MGCEQSRNGLRKGLQDGMEPSWHQLWGCTDIRQLLKALRLMALWGLNGCGEWEGTWETFEQEDSAALGGIDAQKAEVPPCQVSSLVLSLTEGARTSEEWNVKWKVSIWSYILEKKKWVLLFVHFFMDQYFWVQKKEVGKDKEDAMSTGFCFAFLLFF